MRLLILLMVALGACAHEDGAASSVLALSPEEVTLGGTRVVLVKDALRFEYLNLPELEQALSDLHPEDAEVDPCADVRVSDAPRFGIVKRVMFTCAAAGRTRVGFRQASGFVESLALSRPAFNPFVAPPARRFVLSAQKVSFGDVGAALPATGDDRAFAREVIDLTAAALNELTIADQRQLDLALEDDVALGQLLEVVQALEARHFSVRVVPAV